MNQQQQHMMNMNSSMMSMNQINQQPQPQMVHLLNQGYGWLPPPQQFQKLNFNPCVMKPPLASFKKTLAPRSNWKGKKLNKPKDKRRNNDMKKSLISGSRYGGFANGVNIIGGGDGGGAGGGLGNMNINSYQPPTLNELQQQNRLKTRKFFPKKKFNRNMKTNTNMNMVGGGYNFSNNSWSAPYAPRNTTSFLIRAKKSGGIASLVSPSPVTPTVLPTPIFSPSREVLVDMAKEEWGVDGYGSMKGLIWLRSPGHEMEPQDDDEEEEDEGGSSESDVEEHVEVERRLDHDLSRFEMIYDPNSATSGGMDFQFQSVLENQVDDQDSHIAQLEEENLILKERLFLMERELGDLRRRIHFLDRKGNMGGEIINDEVVEDESGNESGSHGEEGSRTADHIHEDNARVSKGEIGDGLYSNVESADKTKGFCFEKCVENKIDMIGGDGEGDNKVCDSEGKQENNKDNEFLDTNKKDNEISKITETVDKEDDDDNESFDADEVEGNNKVVKEHMELKAMKNNIDTESSEPVVLGGDSME